MDIMKQYTHFQGLYPDSVLFIRVGDFYEVFGANALLFHKLLGLTITHRKDHMDIPMVGLPYHSIDSYLVKVIKAGHKIGLVDQVEKTESKVIKRDLVRLTDAEIIPIPSV